MACFDDSCGWTCPSDTAGAYPRSHCTSPSDKFDLHGSDGQQHRGGHNRPTSGKPRVTVCGNYADGRPKIPDAAPQSAPLRQPGGQRICPRRGEACGRYGCGGNHVDRAARSRNTVTCEQWWSRAGHRAHVNPIEGDGRSGDPRNSVVENRAGNWHDANLGDWSPMVASCR